jgi:hypothetical protein
MTNKVWSALYLVSFFDHISVLYARIEDTFCFTVSSFVCQPQDELCGTDLS